MHTLGIKIKANSFILGVWLQSFNCWITLILTYVIKPDNTRYNLNGHSHTEDKDLKTPAKKNATTKVIKIYLNKGFKKPLLNSQLILCPSLLYL